MTKQGLVEVVAHRGGIKLKDAEMIVSIFFGSIREALIVGDRIEIRGFGSFRVNEYKSYEGRNPKTGKKVLVPPKQLPHFKVGKELREKLMEETQQVLV
ncbi:MAG: integration host factor subunit beta [Deltaproteobacteria bacterium]|nr:integration host factor subunit beta [Deltaproteobacteria bacterium]MBW2305792.1 integration host factor subunit beta [Deltaproteobacteria bacterium]